MDAIQISRTGLDVEWQRLQVIAQTLIPFSPNNRVRA